MNIKEQKWLNMPATEIFKNIDSFINDLNDLDGYEEFEEADRLINLLLSLPKEQLISSMISALNNDSDEVPYENCIAFPNAWFKLALNQELRAELIAQLSGVDFSQYVFTFLNGIDEGDGTPGEVAIRSLLDEVGYTVPRDTSLDWSPDGQYKRVTRRKTIEYRTDPIANFSRLMDAVLYYDSTYWDYFLQSVTNSIEKIPVNIRAPLMINDLASRGGVSGALYEYACCWFRLASTPGGGDELEKQLLRLPKDSCVILYFNAMYKFQEANYPGQAVDDLKLLLERANVLTDQVSPDELSAK